MSKHVNFKHTDWGSVEITIDIQVKVYPERVEECHGIHRFNEDEEVSRTLESVKLQFDRGEIDITSRLTKEEVDLLLSFDDEV